MRDLDDDRGQDDDPGECGRAQACFTEGLVARRDAARELELPYRAFGAVADRLVEAVLLGIKAEKRSPARLEAVGLRATLDAPQHGVEANQFGRPHTNAVFAASGKFRPRAVP
jgi:hypothetical protein